MSGLEKLKEMLEEDFMFFESRANNFKDERSESFREGRLSYYYWIMNLINLLIDEEDGKHDTENDKSFKVLRRNKEMLESITIDELQLSVRSSNVLYHHNITDLYILTNMTRRQLSSLRNLGRKSLREIEEKLAEMGLGLRKEEG